MKTDTTFIYTDASFSKAHDIAVIGFSQFTDSDQHELIPLSDLELHFEVISEKNNIRAEIRGAIIGLKSCHQKSKVMLYSDCHAVINLSQRREKLEKQKFISQSNGLILRNADLYQEFYSICDQLKVETHWIKGHSPNKNSDKVQGNFSYLDKQVRKNLRHEISKLVNI